MLQTEAPGSKDPGPRLVETVWFPKLIRVPLTTERLVWKTGEGKWQKRAPKSSRWSGFLLRSGCLSPITVYALRPPSEMNRLAFERFFIREILSNICDLRATGLRFDRFWNACRPLLDCLPTANGPHFDHF
jgi:hypothetical protein